MSVSGVYANSAVPVSDSMYIPVNASGTAFEVNPGDWLAYSGQYAIAANTGIAYWKASGIGMAMDRNPIYDYAGRLLPNTALIVATRGVFRVSANFSGQPNFGLVVNPSTTGSAVNGASGVSGMGSRWNTATPASVSGGTAVAPIGGVAQVINWYNSGPAGTGQMDIRAWDRNGDYY